MALLGDAGAFVTCTELIDAADNRGRIAATNVFEKQVPRWAAGPAPANGAVLLKSAPLAWYRLPCCVWEGRQWLALARRGYRAQLCAPPCIHCVRCSACNCRGPSLLRRLPCHAERGVAHRAPPRQPLAAAAAVGAIRRGRSAGTAGRAYDAARGVASCGHHGSPPPPPQQYDCWP